MFYLHLFIVCERESWGGGSCFCHYVEIRGPFKAMGVKSVHHAWQEIALPTEISR